MSRVRANKITNKDASGAPSFTHGAVVTGIVTATSFQGSGAALTGIDATALKDSGGSVKVQANSSGAVITGMLTATGVLTYEDVTNVDAIGIVTARAGILVGAGKSVGIGTVTSRVPLEVHNTEATGTFINVKSKSNTIAGINFGDFEDDDIGSVRYGNGDNSLRFFANAGSEKFRIGSAGQFGIGGATYGSAGQVLTSGGASAAPTWAAAVAGKVAQVKMASSTTRIDSTTANHDLISCTITPTAATSNILVMTSLFYGGNMNPNGGFRFTRGGTVCEGSAASSQYGSSVGCWWTWDDCDGTNHSMQSASFNWLDTGPSGNGVNTTSAVTYKLEAHSFTRLLFNRAESSGGGTSTLILMEITA